VDECKPLASGGSDSSRVVALEYDERSAALAAVSSSGVEIWHCGQVSAVKTAHKNPQTKTAWPKPATRRARRRRARSAGLPACRHRRVFSRAFARCVRCADTDQK
jgi:hypothetical protein